MQPIQGLFEQPHGQIPPLPAPVLTLMKTPQGTPRREVLAIMRTDMELCSAVLAMAGNTYYSGRRPLTSLSRLVDRVGLSGIRGLFLRSALDRAVFSQPGAVMERLRDHSTATAHISLIICQHAAVHSETAFICALMQHTGIAIPLALLMQTTSAPSDETMVWETLGCAHEAIAGLIAEAWSLPEEIRLVLVRHHQLTANSPADRIIATLTLANLIASELDRGLEAAAHPPPEGTLIDASLNLLDLTASQLPVIRQNADDVLSLVAA